VDDLLHKRAASVENCILHVIASVLRSVLLELREWHWSFKAKAELVKKDS